MRPLFFGTSSHRLYGVHHPRVGPPTSARHGNAGVVLCYPAVQEYNVSHAAFRKLASTLARAGFHVLRFDYFGTGDSAGEMSEGTPELWVDDIRTAARELTDLAAVEQISLVGFRLGGSLAARAVSEGLAVTDLVLWDPVVRGREYIAELEAEHRVESLLLLHGRSRAAPGEAELGGYPFPARVRSTIERIDLRPERLDAAARVLLMVGEERPLVTELLTTLRGRRETVYRVVPEDAQSTNRGARESSWLASRILTAIRDAMIDTAS